MPCGTKKIYKGEGGANYEETGFLRTTTTSFLSELVKGSVVEKFHGCESHVLGVMAIKVLKKFFEKRCLIVREG